MSALVRELHRGGSELRGTTADGVIRIAEPDINEALGSAGAVTGVKLEIQNDNRVLARFGLLHATVVLPPRSDLSESATLTFAVGSIAVAWALKAMLTHPYVRIQGRHITVDLNAVPSLHRYRALLPAVRRLEMTTAAGVLTVRFHVAIA